MDPSLLLLTSQFSAYANRLHLLQLKEDELRIKTARVVLALRLTKFRRSRRYMNKLKFRHRRPTNVFHPPKPNSNIQPEDIFGPTFDFHKTCGLFPELFAEIFSRVKKHLFRPRSRTGSTYRNKTSKTKLSPRLRLLLALYWLRHYPSFSQLGLLFRISESQALKEIHFLLPRLSEALQSEIALPGMFHDR
jgi:hypothetical protein